MLRPREGGEDEEEEEMGCGYLRLRCLDLRRPDLHDSAGAGAVEEGRPWRRTRRRGKRRLPCGRGEAAREEGASPLAGEEGPRSLVLLRSAGGRVGGTHRSGGSRASSEVGAREAGQLAGGAARANGREREREGDRGLLDLRA